MVCCDTVLPSVNDQKLTIGKISIWDIKTKQVGIVELNLEDSEGGFIGVLLDGNYLELIYGDKLNPTFERLSVLDQDGELRMHFVMTRFLGTDENASELMVIHHKMIPPGKRC